MMVNVTCKKCNCSGKLDIGDMPRDQVEEWLNKDTEGFECGFGNHYEFGKRSNFWQVNWDSLKNDKPVTDVEWIGILKQRFQEVYSSDEFSKYYTIKNFAMGFCIATNKEDNEDYAFDFKNSPSGKRYYFN